MIVKRRIHPIEIQSIINNSESVLEIGCGEGRNLYGLRCPIKVGIEGCKELIDKYKHVYLQHNIVVHHMDVFDIDKIFTENQFDYVLAIDIIEHFEKDKAYEVIKKCESIARLGVLCFIPVGNHPQWSDPRGVENPLNNHLSTWYPEDMEQIGYDVYFDDDFHHEPNKDSGAMLAYKFKNKGTN